MWAPELPTNRPQMNPETAPPPGLTPGVRTHMVGAAAPLAGRAEDVPEERVVVTPVEIAERAAAAHDMTFHKTSEAAGARLDPTDPWVPFGATVKGADGEPLTSHDGPLDDPYGIAGGGGTAAASGGDGDEVAALGDGSLAAAEAAIEVIREGGRC
ncbi:hypothetical protein PLESTF_000455900 [Pleodorina starrii]|nr:hypothetical protein PLESTF_000455900 [Pleodorina starrii]